jgi:hypothetical protein
MYFLFGLSKYIHTFVVQSYFKYNSYYNYKKQPKVVNTDKRKIITKLPRKWADTIYDHFNGRFSKVHIQNVMYGFRNNIEIFEQAIKLAEEHQNRLNSIKEKLNNLN